MLQQVGRGGHTSTLRVNPGINMIGDIAARNSPDRAHRETKLFTALQHLRRRGENIEFKELKVHKQTSTHVI